MCRNVFQYMYMETRPGGSVYSRLSDSRCTAVNGTVFTEYTTERRLCFVWERRTTIVTGLTFWSRNFTFKF